MLLNIFFFLASVVLSLVLYYQHFYVVKPLQKSMKECQNNLSEEKTLRSACEKHIRDMEIDYTERIKRYAKQLAKIKQENRFSQITPPSGTTDECQQLKDMLWQYKKIELERLKNEATDNN
jgi:biopolymer transport protein ExbB/TolQ